MLAGVVGFDSSAEVRFGRVVEFSPCVTIAY